VNRWRSSPRRRVTIAVVGVVLTVAGSAAATACSISVEQQPRPITRETTVVPTTVDGN